MKWVADIQSSYGCRLICTGTDIDDAMEERYLKFCNGACDMDHPVFDVESFIDNVLRKERIEYDPEAVDLPENVLGATKFNPDGSKLIRISAELYRQRNLSVGRRRFRFTCAHESFHAMYHGQLFRNNGHLICSDENIKEDMIEAQQSSKDFTEWQANRGAAALLMPHSIFKESVKRIRSKIGSMNSPALVDSLMKLFDVSKQSVQIRLKTLDLMIMPADDLIPEYNGVNCCVDERER